MASHDPSDTLAQLVNQSMFDRLSARLGRPRVLIPLGLFLMLLPVALAFLGGVLEQFLAGLWRELLIQPTIIIYALLISPFLQRAREQVVAGLRPIVQLTDDEFNQLVAEKSRVDPRKELIAIAIGVLIGLIVVGAWTLDFSTPWVEIYEIIATIAWLTMMAWIIYGVTVGPRLVRALLRQPLQVDILDIRPFEPVGRESLMLSFAFIIGATIGMVFSFSEQLVITPGSLVVYGFFAIITVLVFVANMYDTYRVLSRTKAQELNLAQEHISQAYQSLKEKAQRGEDVQASAAEMNTWIACKERISQAPTWPRNTDVIFKLLASALMPAGIAALREIGTALLGMIHWSF